MGRIGKDEAADGIQVTWASARKWAVRDGGDAVVVCQAQRGRVLGVVVDVQGSSPGASTLAWSLATFAVQLAAEGVDAATVASTLNRSLVVRRGGAVSASVAVIVVDDGGEVASARYGDAIAAGLRDPALGGAMCRPAGIDPTATPTVATHRLAVGPVVLCTDGVAADLDALSNLLARLPGDGLSATDILGAAMSRDGGRPRGDMAVVVAGAVAVPASMTSPSTLPASSSASGAVLLPGRSWLGGGT